MNFTKYWRQDFMSSIVVFLVALPLCLGIALASNAPLTAGLFAGIIGGLVVGALSGSQLSVSGPAAGLTVIVAGAISTLGSFESFTIAVFLAGVMQIIFGLLKGGTIGDFFPSSVIKGMLAAIGLILILKQIPLAAGHPGAIVISTLSLVLMIFWEKAGKKGKRFFKLVPGALVAVIMAVLLNVLFGSVVPVLALGNEHLVQLPFNGGVDDFFGTMALPRWELLNDITVYKIAFTLALVGSLESLLSVDASEKLHPEGRNVPKNRELLAQGVGNAISGLIGGLPITAVIVRTTANVSAGAKTRSSAMFHGLWLVLCVMLIPDLLNLIPLSALAAVLLMVGYKLAKPELFVDMYHKGVNQIVPFVATIAAILLTDLLVGIIIGSIVGFAFVIRSNMHKAIVVVSEGKDVLVRFHKDVSFLQKARLISIFNNVQEGSYVVIDGSRSVFVDNDIEELVKDFVKSAPERNIRVELIKSSVALSGLFKERERFYGQDQKIAT